MRCGTPQSRSGSRSCGRTARRGSAHRFLPRQGFVIVGELLAVVGEAEADLIARDGEDLVIVEVKTRETAEYVLPKRREPGEAASFDPSCSRVCPQVGHALEKVRFDVVVS